MSDKWYDTAELYITTDDGKDIHIGKFTNVNLRVGDSDAGPALNDVAAILAKEKVDLKNELRGLVEEWRERRYPDGDVCADELEELIDDE